jgi:hypothetical protein
MYHGKSTAMYMIFTIIPPLTSSVPSNGCRLMSNMNQNMEFLSQRLAVMGKVNHDASSTKPERQRRM